ncbi:base excision DNA repair protein [Diplocarpon rosae]|nr:base excision DNA repair protein [Diplocarpon rosae]
MFPVSKQRNKQTVGISNPTAEIVSPVLKRKRTEEKQHGMGLNLDEPNLKRKDFDSPIQDQEALQIQIVSIPEPVAAKPGARVKKHEYSLTPGISPFPDKLEPTPEACEEVSRILTEAHGHFDRPSTIGPPSTTVTGCGEVPSLLDATLRTILSANTLMKSSNAKLIGLKNTFGLYASGIGKGSINWEKVYRADRSSVVQAITSGGNQDNKADQILRTLDMVYKNNCLRYSALVRQKETGEPSHFRGAKFQSQEDLAAEIDKFKRDPLTMHYIFEMSDEDVMEELLQYHGVGVKTASCVMLFCLQRSSFAVDTHVHRLCRWLGWVPTHVTLRENHPSRLTSENETFSHCNVRVPDHLKYGLHQLFIKHGQDCYKCVAGTKMGSKKWKECVCPLEHLLTRFDKEPGYVKPVQLSKKAILGESSNLKTEELSETELVKSKTTRVKAAKPRASQVKVQMPKITKPKAIKAGVTKAAKRKAQDRKSNKEKAIDPEESSSEWDGAGA